MPDEHTEDRHRADRAAETAQALLAVLQARAAQAYAAITAADEVLRAYAEHRVPAERTARLAAARHHLASRAAAAHAQTRPGPVTELITLFRAGREWRASQAALQDALAATERPLADARRTLEQVKHSFAGQVRARADAARTLRHLTAECAALRQEIAAADRPATDRGPGDTG